MNIWVLFVAAFAPLIIGFIWYNPKVFGNAWMKASGLTQEQAKGGNMAKTFIWTYILSLFAAFGITFFAVHQYHVFSLMTAAPNYADPDSKTAIYYADFMARYGQHFRSIRHGVFHGILGGVTLALPILGINALFERKNFRYIAINAGFWIVSFAVMGGIICELI